MHRFYSLTLFCLLSLMGCKTEKLRETPSNANEKPTTSNSFVLAGRLDRGTIAGARVVLHPISGGAPSWGDALGAGYTDSNGNFALEVDSRHLGSPAFLRAEVLSGQSLITCDLTSACSEGVAFGDVMTASQNSELVLAIPVLQANRAYNITVFSHIAFTLVGSRNPAGQGDVLVDIQLQHDMAQANSKVSSRFGIIGDLISLELIDVTSRAKVESASPAIIGNSLLGTALVTAALNANPSVSFEDQIDNISAQYVSAGMPGNSNITSIVSLVDVLDAAIASAQSLQALYQKDLSGVMSEFSVAKGLAATEAADQYVAGTASDTSRLTGVEKAKSFVDDIRRVALSVDLRKIVSLSNLSEFVDGKAADALAQFGLQLDAAEILQGEQAGKIFLALQGVAGAVLNTVIEYYGGGAVSPSYKGLPYSHSVNGDLHTFAFESVHDFCVGEMNACPILLSLVVKLNIVDFGGNVGSQLIAASYMDMQLFGSIGYGDLTLRFPTSRSPVRIEKPMLRFQEQTEGDLEQSSFLLRGEEISGHVALLMEKNDETALVLSGVVAVEAEKIWAIGHKSELVVPVDGGRTRIQERGVSVREIKGFKVDVAASVRNYTSETFLGAVNIMQDEKEPSGVISWKKNLTEHCAVGEPGENCDEVSSESFIEGETAENFLSLNASIGFKANLRGIATPVLIQMSGSRDSPTTNSINNMKVSYPGRAVSLNGRFNNNGGIVALDAENLDGMQMFIDTVNGKRTGAVETPSKEKVADIIDMGQWVKIRYANGDFESF